MQIHLHPVRVQNITSPLLQEKNVELSVLRLDEIHPIVSGNKLFKLRYFTGNNINNAIITFWGAYSNHLVATAFACRQNNIRCVGVVRGEKAPTLSHTLQHCIQYGMKLHFISRKAYDSKDDPAFIEQLKNLYGEAVIISEGGYAVAGAAGAAGIMKWVDKKVTHICCAAGTATTGAGLLSGMETHQQLVLFPVLKGMTDIPERINFLTEQKFNPQQLHIESGFHFGGYAKKTPELLHFMNELYAHHALPTDFVYTGKMMYGCLQLVKNNFFPPGSKICCIHTGGLQGNLSLPKNSLTF